MKKELIKLANQLSIFDNLASQKILALAQNLWDTGRKSVLILVHPDAALELPRPQAEAYLKKIQSLHSGMYDKIFTLFMFSNYFRTKGWTDHSNFDIYLAIRDHLEKISDFHHDTTMGKTAFGGPIGDYLMENENVTVFMGGGYQDLCLKQSFDNFCSVLNWIVQEQGHEVVIEKQLVYYRSLALGDSFSPHIDDWWNQVEVFDQPL